MPNRAAWRRRLKLVWKRHYAVFCFGLPWLLLFFWAWRVEPFLLVARDIPVEVAGLPEGLNGFTVAVLSDIHLNPDRAKRLDDYAAEVNRRGVDLALLLGDFVNGPRQSGEPNHALLADFVRKLHTRYGVFAVLGNHDVRCEAGPVGPTLEAGGAKVLCDASEVIAAPGGRLNLIGLQYRSGDTRQDALQGRRLARRDMINILLAHAPDSFPEQPREIALMLAGHTHGGQIRLPFYGPLLRYSRYGRRYIYGHIREADGRQLVVTGGLGAGSLNLRFNVPPEILFLRLERAPCETRRPR